MIKTVDNFRVEIESAVEEAKEAFWAVIASKFPEVKSGDFPPDAAHQFDHHCELAVLIWLRLNHPEIV
ncbi:hypothetical protein LFL96_25935 [Paraburkholderia sp. D15]|uniref:hypothetical protein n=1 Tax=Paraburkholderia sp. D15 TaxID=2880218 RepID=UPI00247A4406|nr:hypothetical protein [Paraburkholderia sp. D15]WGS54457.1 hypothetical protein LFL96_25935 [Paraburkholderia sp. D15]